MKALHLSGLWLGLFASAYLSLDCGENGGAGGDKGDDALRKCDLLGSFRITEAPSWACGDFPAVGETVTVAHAASGVVLRAGTMELPMTNDANAGACTFVAHGCHSDPAVSGRGGRYLDVQFTISKTATGIRLVSQATDVDDGNPGACQTNAGNTSDPFDGVPLTGCQPAGTYTAASAASLTSGSCQLSWKAGDVIITPTSDGKFDLDWAGTEVEGLTLDKTACTLRGSKGVSSGNSFDVWAWNGAERHLQIQLQITPAGLAGEAKDALDGTTSNGVSCSSGTYSLQASAPAARPVEVFDATCSASRPSVCGDGVCDPGESCRCTTDCACKTGSTCAPDGVCRQVCTLPTESTDCASGERCSPDAPSYPTVILPSDTLRCVPAGSAGAGDACSETNSCRAGLVCHVPVRGTRSTCAAPCGQGFPACPSGRTCGEQGDGSGVGSYYTAVMACE